MSACVSCGEDSPARERFCPGCGALMPERGAGLIEERKVVTGLFCDLVGSKATAAGADPEDVRAALGPYHARLRTELERYGATVENFIGDAVMAVFGTPAAHEDDAERGRLAEAERLFREAIAGFETQHDATGIGEATSRLAIVTAERGGTAEAGRLTRAAERAERTGAPAFTTASYAAAAQLTQPDAAGGQEAAAVLWERAAQAAITNADYAAAIEHAGNAREMYLQAGKARTAVRVHATAGRPLRLQDRHAEAREQLTAAVQVLRPGHVAPMLRAERDLTRARLAGHHGDPAAAAAAGEARAIACNLRCQPLLDRAEAIEPAEPRVRA
jgi:hypothetical protein